MEERQLTQEERDELDLHFIGVFGSASAGRSMAEIKKRLDSFSKLCRIMAQSDDPRVKWNLQAVWEDALVAVRMALLVAVSHLGRIEIRSLGVDNSDMRKINMFSTEAQEIIKKADEVLTLWTDEFLGGDDGVDVKT